MTILMIGYCQSYATAHLISHDAHEAIAKLRPESRRTDARRLFDLLVTSTLARVAPLAQLTGLVRVAAIYYLLLKLVAVAVLFAIPLSAIGITSVRLTSNSSIAKWVYGLCLFALIVTMAGVFQILIVEFRHVFRVTKLYWTGQLKTSLSA
jgi:hypothetical protein